MPSPERCASSRIVPVVSSMWFIVLSFLGLGSRRTTHRFERPSVASAESPHLGRSGGAGARAAGELAEAVGGVERGHAGHATSLGVDRAER